MAMTRLLKATVILSCVVMYGYSAVRTNRREAYSISIETSRPLPGSLVWPFEMAVVGDNGERGLRIGPNIGRGWRGEAGGQAGYSFYIPQRGRYYIWAHALWYDECSNAVFAQIDDTDKAIVGNDPIYNQWHWVRGFDVDLAKGTHTVVLSNHSDHISLQKILLTNSSIAGPGDCGAVFSDIFYDGFDGCDQGNFTYWRAVRGKWGPENPEDPTCLEESSLTRMSKEEAFIIYEADDWSDYSMNVSVRSAWSESGGLAGVCFGLKGPEEYHELALRHTEKPGVAAVEIRRKTPTETHTMADFEVMWASGQWHQVEIALNPDNIAVRVDDCEAVVTPVDYRITGGIGLRLEGEVTAHFDDIHVRQVAGVEN